MCQIELVRFGVKFQIIKIIWTEGGKLLPVEHTCSHEELTSGSILATFSSFDWDMGAFVFLTLDIGQFGSNVLGKKDEKVYTFIKKQQFIGLQANRRN